MIRLFIALPLALDVEKKLNTIIEDMKQQGGRVKYVEPKNIHLTLKFLGNTDENKVDHLKDAVERVAKNYKPVNTALDTIGSFPNFKRPRVFWIGFSRNVNILENMVNDIENETELLGWEKEQRSFKAHLTLGRVKDEHDVYQLTRFIQDYKLDPIDISFDRITLFKSTLTQKGPIYKRLHEIVLADRFE